MGYLCRPSVWSKRSGVYVILNEVSGKEYIGSTKCFGERWSEHKHALRRGTHGNLHLQSSWNKYGEGSFQFHVLEYCEPEECVVREQHWLDLCWHTGLLYNNSPTAASPLGVRYSDEIKAEMSRRFMGRKGTPHTAESKALIAEAARKQWRSEAHRALVSQKVSRTLTGRKLSAESLAKRTAKQRDGLIARNKSQRQKDFVSVALKGHSVSKETREKIAASLRERNRLERKES